VVGGGDDQYLQTLGRTTHQVINRNPRKPVGERPVKKKNRGKDWRGKGGGSKVKVRVQGEGSSKLRTNAAKHVGKGQHKRVKTLLIWRGSKGQRGGAEGVIAKNWGRKGLGNSEGNGRKWGGRA